MKIAGRGIEAFGEPYLIAEIGVNHGCDRELARRLIDEAGAGGADAVKFQTYRADKLAIRDSPAYWDTSKEPCLSQHELFSRYDSFAREDYEMLAAHARERGLDFISTPFDLEAVEWLDPLVPAFKIASADITNVPLIRACAARGKPLILSTGASTDDEIAFALATARAAGAGEIALLHCVLNYPTPVAHAQLGQIRALAARFPDCTIGYSDHVVPDARVSALTTAWLLGAALLEKHFTHDKTLPGNDHYHAMDGRDIAAWRAEIAHERALLGSGDKNLALEAGAIAHARRSIVSEVDIPAGTVLTEAHLTAKRPAAGISPVHWDEVIGRRVAADVPADTPLQWAMLA